MAQSVVEHRYSVGDVVYLKSDPSQHQRVVVGIVIQEGTNYLYELRLCIDESTLHQECEISDKANEQMRSIINIEIMDDD